MPLNSTASISPPGLVVVVDVDVVETDVVVVKVEIVDVEELEVVVAVELIVPPLQAVTINGITSDSITREINNLFFILPSQSEILHVNNQPQYHHPDGN